MRSMLSSPLASPTSARVRSLQTRSWARHLLLGLLRVELCRVELDRERRHVVVGTRDLLGGCDLLVDVAQDDRVGELRVRRRLAEEAKALILSHEPDGMCPPGRVHVTAFGEQHVVVF